MSNGIAVAGGSSATAAKPKQRTLENTAYKSVEFTAHVFSATSGEDLHPLDNDCTRATKHLAIYVKQPVVDGAFH